MKYTIEELEKLAKEGLLVADANRPELEIGGYIGFLQRRIAKLEALVDRYQERLERIADPTPSMGRPSFTDYELRNMAREALEGLQESP